MENNNYDEAKNKVNIFGQYMVTGVSGPTVDSDGNAVNSKFLLLSVLAHELIHASHDINGGTADGWKGPYIGLDGKKYACSNEEYNTLFGNGSGSVSENDIRSEQGQNLRAGYNEDYSMWKIGF